MFVMILWIITLTNAVTGTATFNDKASCTAALEQVTETWNQKNPNSGASYGIAGGVCSAQGGASTTTTPPPPSAPVIAVSPKASP